MESLIAWSGEHEVIIMSIDGERLLESCTLCSEFETSVENCMLSV